MKKEALILLILLTSSLTIIGQCISNGPYNPGTSISDGSGSVAWTSPNNVNVSDNSRSTASAFVGVLSSVTTDKMLETNFGFSVPLTHTICGIQIDVERSAQGIVIGSSIKDQVVQLIKGGITRNQSSFRC